MQTDPPDRRSRSLSVFYIALAFVALVGVGLLALALRGSGGRLPFQAATLDAAELARLGDRAVGASDAPLTVVEFADFQCGGCAIYAQTELPKIKNQLVDEGLVRFIFVDFPLPSHSHAVLAARAGRCAHDQGAFWEYHDRVYAEHADWAFEAEPSGKFLGYAESLGLDGSRFGSCLNSDQHDEKIRASHQLGRSIGVRATPSVVANGRLLDGVPSADQLRQLALEQRSAP
jgi:protein-disulfide isomerase